MKTRFENSSPRSVEIYAQKQLLTLKNQYRHKSVKVKKQAC